MAKHGPEAHYLRPDSVYITSVLQPTVGGGFNPVQDTAAIAARFVAPTGLAGPVGQIHLLGRSRRRIRFLGAEDGAPQPSLRQRWINFWGRVRANMAANKLVREMRALPEGARVVTVDTSPRGPAPSATALAVQSGWAPAPQSPASAAAAAGLQPRPGDPPNAGPVVTAVGLAPGQAAWPASFWDRVIRQGYPPVVAARAEEDVLTKWFGVKSPTNGGW